MSISVPSKFTKEEFSKLTNKTLNNDDFQQYKKYYPIEMVPENKEHFKTILNNFLADYNFNQNQFNDSQI